MQTAPVDSRMSGSPSQLTELLKTDARRLGFTLVGACPAVAPTGVSRFHEWLQRGYAGEMDYLANRQRAYEHPQHVLDGVRSILMLGLPYRTQTPTIARAGQGRVSRYAWSNVDYHDVIHAALKELIGALQRVVPDAQARGVADTAPLLEREFAQLAGLGWVGKHTLLINKPAGSYFFLAALLTDQQLAYDEPFTAEHCGSCRACLDACPTQAFPQPYVLDATRCISYLTIEMRGAIPHELRSGIGDWLFGCDICQDVCPWNEKQDRVAGFARQESEDSGHSPPYRSAFEPTAEMNPMELVTLLGLDDEAFRRRFRHTPLWRARRRGILRNAAIVLGNQQASLAVPALCQGLNDAEPLVRDACAWALGRLGGAAAIDALRDRLVGEDDDAVKRGLEAALNQIRADQPAVS